VIVFLDTTELRHNPRMTGVKWEKVRRYLQQGCNAGFVTQLVVDEIINHIREDLAKLEVSIGDSAALYARLSGNRNDMTFPKVDAEAFQDEYRSFFVRRLHELHFTIVGSDAAQIDKLLHRALQRRKPFDGHGRAGFRDAVQWDVMLNVIKNTVDSVLFITLNKRDFGNHGSLADDLQEDLKSLGRPGAVTICEGLDAFVTAFVEPTLERLDGIAEQVFEGQYKSFHTLDFVMGLMPDIESVIKQEVGDNGLSGLGYFVRRFFSDPDLYSLDEKFEVIEAEVYRMNDDVVAVTLRLEFKGAIKCEEEATDDPRMGPGAYSEEFIGDATFNVQCGTVINETTGDVLEGGVEDVSISLGYGWPYDDD
jgi:hypothetical protein